MEDELGLERNGSGKKDIFLHLGRNTRIMINVRVYLRKFTKTNENTIYFSSENKF